MKVIACPLVVYICDMIFNDICYSSPYQAIITGLVLAVAGHMMEVLMLKKGTLWVSTFVDLIVFFGLIYVSQFFFPGAYINITGAAITAIILSAAEHFQHMYLIKEGKTRKQ